MEDAFKWKFKISPESGDARVLTYNYLNGHKGLVVYLHEAQKGHAQRLRRRSGAEARAQGGVMGQSHDAGHAPPPPPRDASEGEGPQRGPQRGSPKRLGAVTVGYKIALSHSGLRGLR